MYIPGRLHPHFFLLAFLVLPVQVNASALAQGLYVSGSGDMFVGVGDVVETEIEKGHGKVVLITTDYSGPAASVQDKADVVVATVCVDPGGKLLKFLDQRFATKFQIPFSSISAMSYDQLPRPEFKRPKKCGQHYLAVHYADPSGDAKVVIIALHKDNYKDFLAKAEAAIGKKVEYRE